MNARWVHALTPADAAGVARVANGAARGYVVCCPCGCGAMALFAERDDDIFTDPRARACDLTLFRNLRFACGSAYSLSDGVFDAPK